ncbi:hypothetical protein BDA96_06G272800 [Sorghum bicolor]|uniref:Uncharacterized protein n=1 Tax=Sorghum bicolor TaxID=4558 RepID=A0A921QW54_SORBI|nr:hypothetical protein BDA96_06G272800 [Sorghum bicolor]
MAIAQYSSTMKASCVVLVSILLLATLAAADASSSSPPSSLGRHPALVLGRKGRELGQSSGYNYQHQSKHLLKSEEVAMEVKKPKEEEEEAKAGWTADQGEDAEAGLIYSADYSGVAMHAGSPPTAKPKHRHPTIP